MKKLIIASIFAMSLCGVSFAKYYENATTSVDVLRAQGFSESTVILQDKVNLYNGGQNSTYKRVYQKKVPKSKFMNGYTYLKNYVDPIQDDGEFFEHEINFSNTWMGDSTHYSRPEERVDSIENL